MESNSKAFTFRVPEPRLEIETLKVPCLLPIGIRVGHGIHIAQEKLVVVGMLFQVGA